MGQITRQGTLTLQLACCPSCKTDTIEVEEYGYSRFNPGYAHCSSCHKRWKISYHVKDLWDCGERWNELANKINNTLAVLDLMQVKKQTNISRNFDLEEKEKKAEEFLQKIKDHIILNGQI